MLSKSLSHTVSEINVFYAEIQGGYQKWRENDIWLKLPDDTVYTLGVKNFIEIALTLFLRY